MRRTRSVRRFSRRSRGSLYEMQNWSVCRGAQVLSGAGNCTTPDVVVLPLVIPRQEFGIGAAGSEAVPAFAKGVVFGGAKFWWQLAVNPLLVQSGAPVNSQLDLFTVRSALVVAPLGDVVSNAPAFIPANFLGQQKTQEETGAVTGYTNWRVLWRGLDFVRFTGRATSAGALGLPPAPERTIGSSWDFGGARQLYDVKSKARIDMDHGLFMWTEISYGLSFVPGDNVVMEFDLYGVAAVKQLRRGFGA